MVQGLLSCLLHCIYDIYVLILLLFVFRHVCWEVIDSSDMYAGK